MRHEVPGGMRGRFRSLALPKGPSITLFFCCQGAASLLPRPPVFTHWCLRGSQRLGWICSSREDAAGRRVIGLVLVGTILIFPYLGSRAVPASCSDPESGSWGSCLNRAAEETSKANFHCK